MKSKKFEKSELMLEDEEEEKNSATESPQTIEENENGGKYDWKKFEKFE